MISDNIIIYNTFDYGSGVSNLDIGSDVGILNNVGNFLNPYANNFVPKSNRHVNNFSFNPSATLHTPKTNYVAMDSETSPSNELLDASTVSSGNLLPRNEIPDNTISDGRAFSNLTRNLTTR